MLIYFGKLIFSENPCTMKTTRINVSLNKRENRLAKDKTVQAEIGGYLDCAAHSLWQRSRHCTRRYQSAFHHHSFTGIYDTDGKASRETRGIEKDTGDKGYPDEQPEIGFTYDELSEVR